MATRAEKSKLRRAKAEVGGVTEFEAVAAAILSSIDGIENALEYIRGLPRLRKERDELLGNMRQITAQATLPTLFDYVDEPQ